MVTKRYKKLSFCCALMNRGENFSNLYSSLQHMLGEDIELVVADFGSNDIDLNRFNIFHVLLELPFNKAKGLNRAAAKSSGDVVFFIDADMIAPPNFDKMILSNVKTGQAYFPTCFSLYQDKPRKIDESCGWWRETGYGNCGFTAKDFKNIGRWNENFKKWGGEDDDMVVRAYDNLSVIRDHCDGFFHSWHPNDLEFKERYY